MNTSTTERPTTADLDQADVEQAIIKVRTDHLKIARFKRTEAERYRAELCEEEAQEQSALDLAAPEDREKAKRKLGGTRFARMMFDQIVETARSHEKQAEGWLAAVQQGSDDDGLYL